MSDPLSVPSAPATDADTLLRLQAAVQAAEVGLWDWDLRTNQVYYSPEWKRQIGYEAQELSNDFTEWRSRVHPDDLARMEQAVRAYLQNPAQGFQHEFRFLHKNGSYRWIYTQASLRHDESGKPVRMLGSHIDITTHQQLLAQQAEADRQRAALLESISDAFLALDRDGRFTYVNRKAGELIKRRPEALLGKHIWTEIPEAVGQEFYYAYQRVMSERVPVKKEAYFPPWDRWFESRMYPAPDGGISVYFTDVTTRKQAETLLAGQKYVLELMAANTSLPQTLDALLQVIEAQAPHLRASILLLDDDGVRMRHGAAPSLPQNYTEALDGLAIGPQVGSCGTAMFRREAVIVEDIATDPLWENYRELALAHGLRACWSTPLLDMAGKVLGSFAFYYHQPGRPTERQQQLIDSTTHIATIAIRRHQEEAALRASEARYVDLYEQAPDMHCSVDANTGLIIHCNQRLLTVTGYSRDEIIGQLVWSLCHPDSQDEMHRLWQQFRDNGEIRDAEVRIQCKEGQCRDISLNATAVRDAQGQVLHSRSVWRDITERKQAEHKIRRLNRMYAMLSSINALIIRVREQQELFDDACNMAVETGGFGMACVDKVSPDGQVEPVAMAGADAAQLLTLRQAPDYPMRWAPIGRALHTRRVALVNDLEAELQRGLSNKRRQLAYRLGYRAVISLPLFMEGALVGLFTLSAKETNVFTEDEVKLLTEMAGDISFALDYLAKVQQLDYLAYYDVLTGLPNRTLFRDHIDREVRRAQRDKTQVAIVLCDINRFRHINETLGRQAGDTLLCELARRLRQHWPEADNVGRITADCFGGIITSLKDTADIAHRIETPLQALLQQPINVEGRLLPLALTLGIALAPDDGSESEVLLKNAEMALKEAKTRGERRLLYRPQMNTAVSATLALEIKLRQALERQQFVLHYQPKINLMTGTISGLEALLRWHDPEQGIIPPGHFIPVLEDTGMILEVGRWAIGQALADYHQWYVQGLQPPRIAVNISAAQLRREDFVDSIAQSIKGTRTGPHGLDLELTESQLIEHIDTTVDKLQQLRAMGIKIAIDDFGTGFSSLGYLARLPVDALKIDRSFTMTMVDDANSMSIVAAIISLAHALGLKVVAEGVETTDQKRYLSLLKCDEFQGYLYSPAVAFDQITQLLEKGRMS